MSIPFPVFFDACEITSIYSPGWPDSGEVTTISSSSRPNTPILIFPFRSTSSNTSTPIISTSTLFIPVAGQFARWTPTSDPSTRARTAQLTRASSEPHSRRSARALVVTTPVVPSQTSQGALVLPSIWPPVVFMPCFGIPPTLPSGGSSVVRSLRISKTAILTLNLGEPLPLYGPTGRVISLPLSVISAVRPSGWPSRDLTKRFVVSYSRHQHQHLWRLGRCCLQQWRNLCRCRWELHELRLYGLL